MGPRSVLEIKLPENVIILDFFLIYPLKFNCEKMKKRLNFVMFFLD